MDKGIGKKKGSREESGPEKQNQNQNQNQVKVKEKRKVANWAEVDWSTYDRVEYILRGP